MSLQKDLIEETIDLVKHIDINANRGNTPSLLQLRTLMYIKENGRVKTTDLAKEFNVTPATITSQIDRLVKAKWIERINCEKDRRVIYLCLSTKSKKQVDAMVGNTIQKMSWIFTDLTKAEVKQLYNIIHKMHKTAHRRTKSNE